MVCKNCIRKRKCGWHTDNISGDRRETPTYAQISYHEARKKKNPIKTMKLHSYK